MGFSEEKKVPTVLLDEAKRLAREEVLRHSKLIKVPDSNWDVYWSQVADYLNLPNDLRPENAKAVADKREQALFESTLKDNIEELTKRDEMVKKQLISMSDIEYIEEIYKSLRELTGGNSDTPIYNGDKAPKKVSWDCIIHDPYPKSCARVNTKELLSNSPLFECWDENEDIMINEIVRKYDGKEIRMWAYDQNLKRTWQPKFVIRIKETKK